MAPPNDISALNDAIRELTKALKKSQSSSTPSSGPRERAGLDTQDQVSVEAFQAKRIKDLDVEIAKHEELASIQKMSLDQQLDLKKELEIRQEKLIENGDKLGDHEQKILDLLTAQGEEKEKILKASADSEKIAKKALKEEEKVLKLQQKIREERQQAADMTENMVHSFGRMLGMSAPKKGGIVDVIGALTSKDAETRGEAFAGLKSGLTSMFSPLNIATNLFQKLAELLIYAVVQGDQAASTFAKITGQGREMASASMQAAQSMGSVSANLNDLAAAAANAQNALAGVAGMTRLQASEFGGIALSLERLGVSTGDMTGIISQGMVGFGETSREAAQRLSNLQEAANMMGMSFSDLASSFASNQGSFAAYGHNMTKAFLRTQSTARQLGIELDNLVQLGEKFDTFDSAAETVADLNYIMGGQFLDTMEMMSIQAQEGPEGVARAIREQMEATGKSFEDFSYHQQKALAQSLNMSVGDAQKFLTGAIDDSAVDAVENAVAPVDTLISKANTTLTIMEQFANLMNTLALTIANDIFGENIQNSAELMRKTMKSISSGELRDGLVNVGKGLMVLGKGAMFILGGIGKVFSDTANTFEPIAQLIGNVVSKLAGFTKLLGRFLGPIFGLLEVGKDLFFKFFGSEENKAMANKRLMGGFAGAATGAVAGSIIPGLGTLFGASMGYSLGAAGAENMKGFARGGNVVQGGAALVGERGPEIVVLPTGANVIPNNAFARGGAPYSGDSSSMGKKDVTVHVKLDVNDRKFREMITLNTVDVIEGRGVLA